MRYDKKGAVMPKLRFPEFREEWIVEKLSDVADFVNERISIDRIGLNDYVSTENMLPDFGGVTTASRLPATGSATRFRPNDVLVSNIRPYLKKVWVSDRDGGASNDVIVIRAKPTILGDFLPFALKTHSFIDHVMKGAKGVKMPRGDIQLMREYPVSHPSHSEQRRIAECLTSLDEVIAAQGQKVKALKDQKKGLLQQLFPREGQTVPCLRFPEFRNHLAWEEKPASQLFANRTQQGEEGLPIYSVTMTNGLVKRSSLERSVDDIAEADGNKTSFQNDIVYNMMRMWQGASGVAVEDCMVSPAYVVLAPQAGVHSQFFAFLFKLPKYLRVLTSHSQGLTKDRLRLYYKDFACILLPSPHIREQEAIANLLASIDRLIAVEIAQLEALKTHKTGLTQHLFPSPEVVAA